MNKLTKDTYPLKNEYKNSLKLSDTQRSILVGTLLGDAYLEPRGKVPSYRYIFAQKKSQRVYVEHIYNHFEAWCSKEPAAGVDKYGEITEAYYFKTCTHRCFAFYANQFYNLDKKKVVPKLLHKWLTPMALAYWFMDDGSKKGTSGYALNTQGFSLKEQEVLADTLGRLYHFEVNIHKDRNNYRLYITAKSKDSFTDIIKPFILPSFEYKLLAKSEKK